MSRSYEANGLVTLPRLDVAGGLALATQVIAAAEKEALAAALEPALQRSLTRLTAAKDALQQAAVAQAPLVREDSEAAVAADRDVDSAWAGLHLVLQGVMRFPGFPDQQRHAETLLNALFPNGLDFTQMTFKEEWAESSIRLKRVEEQQLAAHFAALHLGEHHTRLKALQAEYGKALGITDVNAPAAPVPSQLEPLQALGSELRDWVVRVVASVERDVPATGERARRLLNPIEEWKSRAAAGKDPVAQDGPAVTPV
jgi:hypothetical protein